MIHEFRREFLCLNRKCCDEEGNRTTLGIIRRNGDLDITGPVARVVVAPSGWSLVCDRCQTARAFYGRSVHWHAHSRGDVLQCGARTQ